LEKKLKEGQEALHTAEQDRQKALQAAEKTRQENDEMDSAELRKLGDSVMRPIVVSRVF